VRAQPRVIDAGELGEHLFFNVAGIGLDAHVAALVTTRVHHRGFIPYFTATAGDLLRYQPTDYTIEMDGTTTPTSALVLAFANSRQWGFGAQIAPAADLTDGVLDFVVVQDRGFVGNALRVPALFLRRIDRQRGIDTHRVRQVTIRSKEPMLFHVDGEAVQGTDTLIARVHPGALRLQA
jgi:diacylglycerol kinase (ATP)